MSVTKSGEDNKVKSFVVVVVSPKIGLKLKKWRKKKENLHD